MGRFKRYGAALLATALLAACSQEILLRDLPEQAANEIIAVLETHSISASKQSDAKGKTFAVQVATGDLARASQTLTALGYPKLQRNTLHDIFKPSGFAPTPFEERVRYVYGMSQELERTIALLQGVLHTRVHVVIPDTAGVKKVDWSTAKASVLISYDDRFQLEDQVPKIRQLVSDAIEGLVPKNVEVLLTPNQVAAKSQSAVQVVSFLGVRIYQQDFTLFLVYCTVFLSALLVFVVLAFERFSTRLRTWFTKHRP